MSYKVNLFGINVDVNFITQNDKIILQVSETDSFLLKNYLKRTLPSYGMNPTEDFPELIQHAITIEGKVGRISEPKVKLPYDIPVHVKEKLVRVAAFEGETATRSLIRLIEETYEEEIKKMKGEF